MSSLTATAQECLKKWPSMQRLWQALQVCFSGKTPNPSACFRGAMQLRSGVKSTQATRGVPASAGRPPGEVVHKDSLRPLPQHAAPLGGQRHCEPRLDAAPRQHQHLCGLGRSREREHRKQVDTQLCLWGPLQPTIALSIDSHPPLPCRVHGYLWPARAAQLITKQI